MEPNCDLTQIFLKLVKNITHLEQSPVSRFDMNHCFCQIELI